MRKADPELFVRSFSIFWVLSLEFSEPRLQLDLCFVEKARDSLSFPEPLTYMLCTISSFLCPSSKLLILDGLRGNCFKRLLNCVRFPVFGREQRSVLSAS